MHVHICATCYYAHHYGYYQAAPYWVIGDPDDDVRVEAEPLRLLAGYNITADNGDAHFSSSSCEGCGNRLGGDRYEVYITDPSAPRRDEVSDDTDDDDWDDVDCVHCATGARHTHGALDLEHV